MDLRIDRKFYFNSFNLITYIEVQNLFNRSNVYEYYWKYSSNSPAVNYDWQILPVFGVSAQF